MTHVSWLLVGLIMELGWMVYHPSRFVRGTGAVMVLLMVVLGTSPAQHLVAPL